MNIKLDFMSRRDNMWVEKKYRKVRRAIGTLCADYGLSLISTCLPQFLAFH